MNPELILTTLMRALGVKADPAQINAVFDFAKTAIPLLAQKVDAMDATLARIEANQKIILERIELWTPKN